MRLAASPKTCHQKKELWHENLRHNSRIEDDKTIIYGNWEGKAFHNSRPFVLGVGKVVLVMNREGSQKNKSKCVTRKKASWKFSCNVSQTDKRLGSLLEGSPLPLDPGGATPSQLDQPSPRRPSAVWQMSQPACLHFQIIHSNVSWVDANTMESTSFSLKKKKEKENLVACFCFYYELEHFKEKKNILSCKVYHLWRLLV